MGNRETAEYEIMGFYLASKESHLSYTAVIKDLYDRGVREPLLFIADGLPKLDEEIRKVFPRADFQLCIIHASRNFESEVREMDKAIIDKQLKRIFLSDTREEAILRLEQFKSQWNRKYPRHIYDLEQKTNYLFTYFQYPQAIRRSIHSNNIIERMNKEVRRRIM
jgi:putative transposase